MIQSQTATCFPTGHNPISSGDSFNHECDISVQGDVQWYEESLSWTQDRDKKESDKFQFCKVK